MAYAEVAGLTPVAGLYALLLPVVAYALLGSSRQLSIGPDGTISTLVAVAVLPLAVAASAGAAELAAILALMVAACFAVAWLLRLGWIADYLSGAVLLGYIHGVAVVLIIGQLGKLFGLSISAHDPLAQLWEALREAERVSGLTVALATASLATLLGLRFLMPRLPAALVVVAASVGISWALDLLGLVELRQGNVSRAIGTLRASLDLHLALGDRWRQASLLDGLARAFVARGEVSRAAELLALAAALRETIGTMVPAIERPAWQATWQAVQERLSEKDLKTARIRGGAATVAGILAKIG